MAEKKVPSTRDAMEDLDRIFHEKARLGILTSIISTPDPLNFNELKELCGLTDGNLNRHLKVLLDSKILSVSKTGRGRNTNSAYKLTAKGKKQFNHYLSALESILKLAQPQSASPRTSTAKKRGAGNVSPATS